MTPISKNSSAEELKKLPFTKSWANNYVSKKQMILDITTSELRLKELSDFLYIPASIAINYYSNDRNFLAFRNDHKKNGIMDFKLLADPIENENSRIVLLYIAIILAELKIFFMIDNKYGVFIEIGDLHKKANEEGGVYKDLYRHFAIPKQIAQKNGIVELWAN